jgi:hypothetical protein
MDRGGPCPTPCRFQALHRQWNIKLVFAWRAYQNSVGQGFTCGQLKPGWWKQGYLGHGEWKMISRVAEHCFWMSRYLERSENTARVLDVNQTLLLDFDVPVEPLLIISGIHDFPNQAESEIVQYHMTWDRDNACSIASSLAAARENARIIREVISADMWEQINHYHLWMQSSDSRRLYDDDRNAFYNQIKRINQIIFGICEGTMSHGTAWDFFKLGILYFPVRIWLVPRSTSPNGQRFSKAARVMSRSTSKGKHWIRAPRWRTS